MPKPLGRHPQFRLTALRIKNAKPGRHADGGGLHLEVDRSGARRWMLRTVVRGRRCDIGLGSCSLVSLGDARAEAVRLRRIARSGGDPLAERRRERRGSLSFRDAAKRVHGSLAPTFRNEKHRAQWLSSLETYAFPVFGDRSVEAIETPDVLKVLDAIWTTKSETAMRVRQRVRAVFEWAKAAGFRSGDNPVDGIKRVLPKNRNPVKHHAALPYQEVPGFLAKLRNFETNESIRLGLEFLILTATRTNEVLQARWSEIDLVAKTWTVPANRMKTSREHRVPLSPRCVQLLKAAKGLTDGGPFVFPGRYPNRPLSNMVFLMVLRRMGITPFTSHGFRSTFRVWVAEQRPITSHEAVESALAHVVRNKVEAAYFRSDLFELRRQLMDAWAAFATSHAADRRTAASKRRGASV